ncbi:MAG: SGNH/GDSL hydrolase family protein [Pirellulales bacterium]
MKRSFVITLGSIVLCLISFGSSPTRAQDKAPAKVRAVLGVYEYEGKPNDDAFAPFNPAKAPPAGALLLKTGDRLAIVGDSITEQKMYSRIIESYLTVCVPELKVTVRQYGWSGEKTDGFLRRMDQDCLRFKPTVATLCYGMNDSRYRPYDAVNGRWYRDHLSAIVDNFQADGVRVIVGSPGCTGKIAAWVQSRQGTLQEHNLNLCTLRDIALETAQDKKAAFADIFWPMYQAQVTTPKRLGKTPEEYAVAGKDGVHPGWAGQTVMAYAFLKAMGLSGDLGTYDVDLGAGTAAATGGHVVKSFTAGELNIESTQYPFCATGALDDDNSIRSGMTLVPFSKDLNRLTLKVRGLKTPKVKVTWGSEARVFSAEQAAAGINLADEFHVNPFSESFARVDTAVYAKQAYETEQIKAVFHGERGKKDIEAAATETEAKRQPLADAIQAALKPVSHTIRIEPHA